MADLIPTAEIARRYGVIERRVRQIAQQRGIEPAATRCPCCGARGHYWTPEQADAAGGDDVNVVHALDFDPVPACNSDGQHAHILPAARPAPTAGRGDGADHAIAPPAIGTRVQNLDGLRATPRVNP